MIIKAKLKQKKNLPGQLPGPKSTHAKWELWYKARHVQVLSTVYLSALKDYVTSKLQDRRAAVG